MKYTTTLTAALLGLSNTITALPQPSTNNPLARALPDQTKNPYYYAAVTTLYNMQTGAVDFDASYGELVYETPTRDINGIVKDPGAWKATIVDFIFNAQWSKGQRGRFQRLVNGSSTSTTFRVEGKYRLFDLYSTEAQLVKDHVKWEGHESGFKTVIRDTWFGTYQVPDRGGLATLTSGSQEFDCFETDVNRMRSFALVPKARGTREKIMWDKVGAGAFIEPAKAN